MSKRYFWAAGTHSQGFNSYGQEELLNIFGRCWAVCRMDYDCVRGTPMIFANLPDTPAFHRNVNFFLGVMPDIPVVWMPESSIVSAPNGSELIVVLPEMFPDHMPCRAAFVSRVLWPSMRVYLERRGVELPRHDRIVLMKVPRRSANSPERSFTSPPRLEARHVFFHRSSLLHQRRGASRCFRGGGCAHVRVGFGPVVGQVSRAWPRCLCRRMMTTKYDDRMA